MAVKKKTKLANPANMMLVNATTKPKNGKKTPAKNGKSKPRKRNTSTADIKDIFIDSIVAALGGMTVTYAASKLPLPTNPIINIGAKVGLALAGSYAVEKVEVSVLKRSGKKSFFKAFGIGGVAVAATDALKIAMPGLRTVFIPNGAGQKLITGITESGEVKTAELAGIDEIGDIVAVNPGFLGDYIDAEFEDVESEFGDIVSNFR